MWSSPVTSPRRSRYGAPPRSPPTPCTPQKPLWMLRCESACAQSRYPTNFCLLSAPGKGEDRLVVDCRAGETLWAVFDGHRSREVSGFASMTIPQLVWNCDWRHRPDEALIGAFRQCHELARAEGHSGGSTAVVVVTAGDALYCASAGDSRVVAGLHGGGVVRLSVHHSTSVPEEVARIQAAGGNLEMGRLGGFLPMTRGLGDFDLETEGFISVPDVRVFPRSEVDFVVIASDGLWDVMNDETCCNLIRQWGPSASAEGLAHMAQQLGSNDDIAIIIAHIPSLSQPNFASASLGA
mmetsp:Transcript_82922/g.130734  ORF Transcript_82922/g.130734 Transcript_82922/m.130734 type:complete len:295 (-) Transcript_82922:176-1060(-)